MSTVLMIGTVVPEELRRFCFDRGVKQAAADVAQIYMLHGLESIETVKSLDSIGAVRIKPYPKTRIPVLRSLSQSMAKGTMHAIGYWNMPLIGFWLREKRIVRQVKKWARAHVDDAAVTVLVYSMHSPFMKAAKAVKKIIPTAIITLVVADLPLLMDMKGALRARLKQMDWRRIQRLMKSVDKYLLYTRHMAEYLALPDGKWTVFEGLMDEKRVVKVPPKKDEKVVCLYAGNLNAEYGIDMLMEAFGQIQSRAVLHIYGTGVDVQRIIRLAQTSPHVEYKGLVTVDEMFALMQKATLLINPRPTTIGLAKYSCPSKTFEYMASGTPVLMTHLPGLPQEYTPYLYFVDEETAEGFAAKIDEILSCPQEELADWGMKAADFLRREKNSGAVMRRMLAFIEDAAP